MGDKAGATRAAEATREAETMAQNRLRSRSKVTRSTE
jgi:hypothetical protein